jgi:hypothetical protein
MIGGSEEGTTRIQDAPRPTELAFNAPTKAKPSLPDDDPNSVSTKWGRDCGIPMRPMFRGQAVKTPSRQ